MTYTVTKLITNSYYLSGKYARGYETISGDDLIDGLELLNAVLAIKSANLSKIPYFLSYQLTLTEGVETYTIPGLVETSCVTFFIEDVRYLLQFQTRNEYFGSSRVVDIQSLPMYYHTERALGGTNLFLYPLPQSNYPCEIQGKFSLTAVRLNQDLSLILDPFYIEYLRYALARQIADENNISFLPQNEKKLAEYEVAVTQISPIDLSMNKVSTLQGARGGFDPFMDANIYKGWRP